MYPEKVLIYLHADCSELGREKVKNSRGAIVSEVPPEKVDGENWRYICICGGKQREEAWFGK